MCMAYDDGQFAKFISRESNASCQFVSNIMKSGAVTSATYEERGLILKELFGHKRMIGEQTELRILSYAVETANNCIDTMTLALPEFPSVCISYNCSDCGHALIAYQSTMLAAHQSIIKNGLESLANSIQDYYGTEQADCSICQSVNCSVSRKPNFQIIIELDVRTDSLDEKNSNFGTSHHV